MGAVFNSLFSSYEFVVQSLHLIRLMRLRHCFLLIFCGGCAYCLGVKEVQGSVSNKASEGRVAHVGLLAMDADAATEEALKQARAVSNSVLFGTLLVGSKGK